MLKLLAAAAVLLVLVHEGLAWRAGSSTGWRAWVRRLVLVALIVATGLGGDRANVQQRLRLLASPRASVSPASLLDGSGDPFLLGRVAKEVPAHPYPEGQGGEAIAAWQRDTREALRTRAEFRPPIGDVVETTVVSQETVGDVTRTLVTFRAADGTRIPAFVHEPTRGGRGAGLLVVPGHGQGARSTAGLAGDDYQHRAALELARRGFVTLTPEMRGFGLLTASGVPMHRAVAATALQTGTFYKAIVVGDLARALTVLSRWRGVDPARLGVAGASLGGEIAVMLGVLDDRVRAVASQSYGGNTGPAGVAGTESDEDEQTAHGCHTVPGINTLIWQEDWFRLLAPRPAMISRGRTNTPRESEAFAALVRRAFAEAGGPDRFSFTIEPGGHEFFIEPVAAFFERWL